MVGPARTIFHLCGRPDIVRFFDDPAYVLEDEIVSIPYGCDPAAFLLRRYEDEGKVPMDTPMNRQVTVVAAVAIPRQVTASVTTQRLIDLFPNCRPLGIDEAVRCVRSKHHKDPARFVLNTKRLFVDGFLEKNGLMFMGLSLSNLERCLSFFVPVICSNNFDNEFGPGIYTTDQFELAKDYAKVNGAVMVFDKLEERDLQVWRPELDAWNRLTATWLKLPLSNIRLPCEYGTAQVIVGPTSCDQSMARKNRRFPRQSDDTQFAFVSYEGCSQLRKSLLAIIFIT
ncbi:hypothetical protein BDW42DRAFT_201156 [Aspergillus taichungensis]|uniref:Uncharacterized protein n=1 Tax=Aspergillus taichungensis TaxID=482145 RepID=A0A2J5I8J1_9EURO|nr:hypothetical protein BDW42DRAFT_201156 [Aspergillus taichungensis]